MIRGATLSPWPAIHRGTKGGLTRVVGISARYGEDPPHPANIQPPTQSPFCRPVNPSTCYTCHLYFRQKFNLYSLSRRSCGDFTVVTWTVRFRVTGVFVISQPLSRQSIGYFTVVNRTVHFRVKGVVVRCQPLSRRCVEILPLSIGPSVSELSVFLPS